MFQLSRLEDDNVKILPENLGKPTLEAIVEVIERLYVDKVIRDLGLVITLYDVVSVEGGTVYPGEGSAHFKVVFRVVVFRPFVGEVLEATLKRSDEEGLRVSLGFFDDVFVPAHLLQDPSNFDDKEKLWVWEYQGDAKQKMHFDLEEKIRVRVQSVRFPDHPTRDARRGGEDVVMATRSALEGGAGEPLANSNREPARAVTPCPLERLVHQACCPLEHAQTDARRALLEHPLAVPAV